ncbi:MAG: 3-dehydroquinate synthase, partial [bacterium]
MEVVHLALGKQSYPIYIGSGLISNSGLIRTGVAGNRVLIVTNETIAPLYVDRLKDTLSGLDVDTVELPDGERFKNLETLNLIFDVLLTNSHNRN